jgi:hypothetical protein
MFWVVFLQIEKKCTNNGQWELVFECYEWNLSGFKFQCLITLPLTVKMSFTKY